MIKRNFIEQVAENNSKKVQKEENAVKEFTQKKDSKKTLKRTCVLVDGDTWDEFKQCTQRYGITASAQINLFITKFIQAERKRIREEESFCGMDKQE